MAFPFRQKTPDEIRNAYIKRYVELRPFFEGSPNQLINHIISLPEFKENPITANGLRNFLHSEGIVTANPKKTQKLREAKKELFESETKTLFYQLYEVLLDPKNADRLSAPYKLVSESTGMPIPKVKMLMQGASAQDAILPFIQDIPAIMAALSKNAKEGNSNAANTFLKYIVMYSPPASLKETLDVLKTLKEKTPVHFIAPPKEDDYKEDAA